MEGRPETFQERSSSPVPDKPSNRKREASKKTVNISFDELEKKIVESLKVRDKISDEERRWSKLSLLKKVS